jgi:hypothetical protein
MEGKRIREEKRINSSGKETKKDWALKTGVISCLSFPGDVWPFNVRQPIFHSLC